MVWGSQVMWRREPLRLRPETHVGACGLDATSKASSSSRVLASEAKMSRQSTFVSRTSFHALDVESGEESEEEVLSETPDTAAEG